MGIVDIIIIVMVIFLALSILKHLGKAIIYLAVIVILVLVIIRLLQVVG
jgi:hypothetical protein